MTTKTKTTAGTITLEIELEKSLSHGRRLSVDITWEDMSDLPLSNDLIFIDRAEIRLVSGPVGDETILDQPESLTDFTWKGICQDPEWMTIETFAKALRQDRRVLGIGVIQ